MLVRIVSPRWDAASNRWLQPGEEIRINADEFDNPPFYSTHAVRVPEPAASPAPVVPPPEAAPAAVEVTVEEERVFEAPADKMVRSRRSK